MNGFTNLETLALQRGYAMPFGLDKGFKIHSPLNFKSHQKAQIAYYGQDGRYTFKDLTLHKKALCNSTYLNNLLDKFEEEVNSDPFFQ